MDLSELRVEYETAGLSRKDLDENPIAQFGSWISNAINAEVTEPNAMVVSTVDSESQPWSRHVLLKKFDSVGFVFFTNFTSDKSLHLDSNPKIAASFGWLQLHQQVNITGAVERVSESESDIYWQSRSKDSQIGSASSEQSSELKTRTELLKKRDELSKIYEQTESLPRPDFWGGWRIVPSTIEFWQGRKDRLHDRFRYELLETGWEITRLNP